MVDSSESGGKGLKRILWYQHKKNNEIEDISDDSVLSPELDFERSDRCLDYNFACRLGLSDISVRLHAHSVN